MRSNNKLPSSLIDELYTALACDFVRDLPNALIPFSGKDLDQVVNKIGNGILSFCDFRKKCFCLAYFLDLGLNPFVLDHSGAGWSAVHLSIKYSHTSLRYLMGMAFTDSRFPGFTMHDGTTVEDLLEKLSGEAQAAFRETQTIFYTYRSYHDFAETAEEHHDYLIAALYYFLAASQMKTKVADEEDDFYLKRFHLKKVVGDLRKAIEHYYQAILEEGKTLGVLDEFDQCLALSAEIIDSVEPDHPERDWEIKLGDREFFDAWRKQLEALQKWCEERRISFSSASSETSGVSAEDAKTSEEPIRDTDDEKASLLDEAGGLRHRFKH